MDAFDDLLRQVATHVRQNPGAEFHFECKLKGDALYRAVLLKETPGEGFKSEPLPAPPEDE